MIYIATGKSGQGRTTALMLLAGAAAQAGHKTNFITGELTHSEAVRRLLNATPPVGHGNLTVTAGGITNLTNLLRLIDANRHNVQTLIVDDCVLANTTETLAAIKEVIGTSQLDVYLSVQNNMSSHDGVNLYRFENSTQGQLVRSYTREELAAAAANIA